MFQSSRNRAKNNDIVPIKEEEEELEDADIFMKGQYDPNNEQVDGVEPVNIKDDKHEKAVDDEKKKENSEDNNENDNYIKQSNESIANSESDSMPSKPKLKREMSDRQIRKERKKEKAVKEFLELQAEKKRKEEEDNLKYKAFMVEVEERRRAAIKRNKANRKRNAIFASQRDGLRKRLCAEWHLLTEAQKISTRALRSKRGIKCPKCGTLGYFAEICPNDCYVEDERTSLEDVEKLLCKPQQKGYDDFYYEEKAEGGEGYLWGPNTTYAFDSMKPEREKIHRGNTKANLNPLKSKMKREKATLQSLDEGLPDYAFHTRAEDGYHRDLSELSLHNMLRYVMRIMEAIITKNAERLESEKDYDLFHPPFEKPGQKFYPKEIWDIKEHRAYLTQQAEKQDRKVNQSHSHHGSTRPDDAMDAICRGGSIKEMNAMYHPKEKAGQSMHSKIGWKSTMSTGDDLAIADPKMQAKVDAMEKLMKKQTAWTRVQKKAFENTNERYIHIWNIVKEEVTKEHDREYRLLSVDVHSNLRETQRDVWVERLDAADRIIDTLLKYKYINGSCEADYALESLKKWRIEYKESLKRQALEPGSGHRNKKKPIKKKIKAKRIFAKMGMSNIADEDEERGEDEDKEGDDDVDDDSSLLSFDTETRMKLANLGTALSTSNKGGYKGLGFASEFGSQEVADSYDCNAAITAALLSGGADSLFEEQKGNKGDKAFKKTTKKTKKKVDGTERAIFQKLNLKYQETQTEIDKKKMALIEKKYTAVGMHRNIRTGSNEDNSQRAPSLIPIHEVFSGARDDHIKSKVADEAVLRARLSRTNGITGYIGKEYVPMYVRNTLFEKNGCSEGGDQTFDKMCLDSRYSAQVGRSMQSLEPSKDEQKNLQKKFQRSVRMSESGNTSNLPNLHRSASTSTAYANEKKVAKIKF